MVFYHNINPIIFSFGPLQVRWYGLMYVIAFIITYFYLKSSVKKGRISLTEDDVDWYIIITTVSLIIGARIFEVLFYNPGYYFTNPSRIIAIWQGGLSFHGGLTGVIVSSYFFCRKKGIKFLELADVMVVPLALGLAFGRVGNFINGELYGRITTLPWAVKFPGAKGFRHPSQLYESAKNLIIFFTLFSLRNKKMPRGYLLAVFLVMYSVFRFFIEFVREPTVVLGHLTLGQWFNIPMFAAGVWMIIRLKKG